MSFGLKSILQPIMFPFSLLGLCLAFGQMPFDLPLLAFFSLVLLGYLWQRLSLDLAGAFRCGFAFGFSYFAITFAWIIQPFLIEPYAFGWIAPFAFLGLVGILSICWAVAFSSAAYLSNGKSRLKKLLMLWATLSLMEIFRSDLIFNFPWGLISAIWINTSISQALSLCGPHGLTSIIILSAFLVSKPIFSSVLGSLLLSTLFFFGTKRLNEPLLPKNHQFYIRVVQPNIPQAEKWEPALAQEFLQLHLGLSKVEHDDNVDLIVWPETAINFFFEYDEEVQDTIRLNIDSPLILGLRRFEPKSKSLYNSAYVLDKNGEVEYIYDKTRLVPFGEYIPFDRFFSQFGIFGLATDGITGFTPGHKKEVVNILGIPPLAISICYETIFSSEINDRSKGAEWLLQITNDAWFGRFNGPPQHLTLARMRAIEQGLPLLRSANTGISGVVDSYGRVIKQLDIGERGYIDINLPSNLATTLYSRIGGRSMNLYIILVLLLTIVSLLFIKRLKLR